jgi:hypothetical protein
MSLVTPTGSRLIVIIELPLVVGVRSAAEVMRLGDEDLIAHCCASVKTGLHLLVGHGKK